MTAGARRLWLMGLGAGAVPLAVAAIAWACTPTAELRMDRASAAPGTVVDVTGRGFSEGLVEIRMDSTDSAPVATASGPAFAISMTIPQTNPGWHVVGAVGYDESGSVVGDTSTTVFVTGDGRQPEQAPPVQRAPSPSQTRTAPKSRTAPVKKTHAPSSAPVQRAAPQTQTRGSAARTPEPSATATAPSAAPVVAAAGTAHRHVLRATPGKAAPPERAIAQRDNWAPPPPRAAPAAAADAWAPGPVAANSSGPAGPGLAATIGAGLLGVGLVALFGGFAVAEVRRRRAPARARRRG